MKKALFLALIILLPFISKSQTGNARQKIDTTEIVEVNGIKQFISIKGNDNTQPMLLLLHGGPGKSLIESAESFSDKLKNEFIVVNWDQRQTGETSKLNEGNQPLSVDIMISDAEQIIQYILHQYNRQKLYLVSHSWGSVLGFDIARNHPELLYAYVGISPIIDERTSEILTLKMLKEWSRNTNDSSALSEINQINLPLETTKDLFTFQKWLFIKNDVAFARKDDFKTNYYNWMNMWFRLWKESVRVSMFDHSKTYDCPVYFIEGNADKYESHNLVKDYYNYIKAPQKDLYWMKKSGHTVFNTEPDKLQEVIIKIKKKTM
jgi:pimeloyl-ACP methyl ester carboxylesterase